MTISLQFGPKLNGQRVAVLVETKRATTNCFKGLGIWLSKKPLAILIDDAGSVSVTDMSGAPMDTDMIEQLCPGALVAFKESAEPTPSTTGP
ncbi:MAG: hypothetical protein JJ908_06735 [Rhizobiales bacterium]|nr:hypothetical protein [Hyphomicrobiales bacterium]MBO6697699.1 hypothetical protein [Hyphomicrobiales bacterium]MBO6736046.1 hypothetical protein [Hyphomicrobiales bacterium]MBO6912516.1 hypothetical protein [Hyphomicrobiales bacterium]MBO6956357.1 hypothetical protein [Hyphomicrobiales bacterium]